MVQNSKESMAYWMKIFPSFSTPQRLIQHINDIFSVDIQNMADYYNLSKNDKEIDKVSINSNFDDDMMDTFETVSKQYPLCNVFEKIVRQIVTDDIANHPLIKDKKKFLTDFFESLCESLISFSTKILINELGLMRDYKLLEGETSKDRFEYFTNVLLRNDDYQSYFFDKYNELYRTTKKVIQYKYTYVREILSNLLKYRTEISACFFQEKPYSYIAKIEYNKGDSHRLGKFVAVIEFDKGERLVYKPKSLSIEEGFNNYLRWINEKILPNNRMLYIPKLFFRNSFGLVEYIRYEDCTTRNGINEYYYKAGALLAILYSINAKDIHHENIIAYGDNPVVIDLDALFHNCLFLKTEKQEEKDSFKIAMEKVDSSVYTIGLLPMHISCDKNQENSVDVGGLGGEERQLSPFRTYRIKNKFTDQMCFEESEMWIETQKNIPRFNGNTYGLKQYKDEIVKGFTDVYMGLMTNNALALEIVKKCFAKAENRLILRPTYLYGKLINLSCNPEFMRQQADRKLLLSRLGIGIDVSQNEIVLSEIEDIMDGDVPYFSTYVASTRIYNSRGKALNIQQLSPSLEIAMKKIKEFSVKDLEEQIQIINNSFIGKELKEYKELCQTNTKFHCESVPYSMEKNIELAKRIGRFLIDKSIKGNANGKMSRSWIGYTPIGHDSINYQYGVNYCDLYNGNAGIALYFTYLSRVTEEKMYLDFAYEIINPVMKILKKVDPESALLVGPYNGLSGYLYAIHKLYEEMRDGVLVEYIRMAIQLLKNLYMQDRTYDIIGGCSGALKVVITLLKSNIYDTSINAELQELVDKLSRFLCNHCTVLSEEYIAWECIDQRKIAFSGYAHGVSGILTSLYLANTMLHCESVAQVVKKALNFERSLYDPKRRNWSANNIENKYSYGWCHGAPGILLSKSILIENGYRDTLIKGEIECAIDTTIRSGFGNNICLCHGDLGNLEILKRISKTLDMKELDNQCDKVYGKLFETSFEYISKMKVFPVGMMLGSAGIGLAALQTISNKVPSILTLE